MHVKIPFLIFVIGTLLFTSCSAENRHRELSHKPASPRDIGDTIHVMLGFANGSLTATSLVHDITATQPEVDVSQEYHDYHHGPFRSMEGYRIDDLEVRVRAGGFDAASFILLHVNTDPCVPIESLANAAGAVDEIFISPLAHAPDEPSGRGYALDTETGGRLAIYSVGERPWSCVTLITASPD